MSFAPQTLFYLGPLPITNTVLNTLFVDAILLLIAFAVWKNVKLIPGMIQNVAEIVIGGFYNFTKSIAGDRADKIFPYFMSFFLFILVANWSGLIPGITTIGFVDSLHGKEHITPLLRSTTTDLNTTLALAVLSLIATHFLSVRTLGIKEYFLRYLSLNPIFLFVGVLEIVSEATKLVSLSFRLFGNVYAGEIVLETIAGIFAFIFPLPFLLLEVIVGFVQALVFSMLTLVFMVILTTPHGAEEVSHE